MKPQEGQGESRGNMKECDDMNGGESYVADIWKPEDIFDGDDFIPPEGKEVFKKWKKTAKISGVGRQSRMDYCAYISEGNADIYKYEKIEVRSFKKNVSFFSFFCFYI